ncbi:hypothetical protein C8T65DRAFT_138582 [Cerioporus squamosus]|nr:hypothetical protein C8T65DRAFT_138526 [Cerioporus squamosus]KAI0715776.1 hypothetical protein C8T65DRAFT_138582 [Cerioporus squamosus]
MRCANLATLVAGSGVSLSGGVGYSLFIPHASQHPHTQRTCSRISYERRAFAATWGPQTVRRTVGMAFTQVRRSRLFIVPHSEHRTRHPAEGSVKRRLACVNGYAARARLWPSWSTLAHPASFLCQCPGRVRADCVHARSASTALRILCGRRKEQRKCGLGRFNIQQCVMAKLEDIWRGVMGSSEEGLCPSHLRYVDSELTRRLLLVRADCNALASRHLMQTFTFPPAERSRSVFSF